MSEQLEDLIRFCEAEDRVCPMPQRWNELWDMLPEKKRIGSGGDPPVPLILGAWYVPAPMKRERLRDHLSYAEKKGVLNKIGQFLRNLPEEDWFKEK